MERAIGSREQARSASTQLQHLRWHDVLEVVVDEKEKKELLDEDWTESMR
jgi:hypothetical protein